MAKKKEQTEVKTETKAEVKQKKDITKFCAFWGITLAATLFVSNGILQLIKKLFEDEKVLAGINSCMEAFDFVAKLALLVAVAIPAYAYVRKKKLSWKITYIFSIVFYAIFCVYHLF